MSISCTGIATTWALSPWLDCLPPLLYYLPPMSRSHLTWIFVDGSVLYVNGKLVANNDGVHVLRGRSGTVDLTDGWNTIEIRLLLAAHPH